MCLILRWVFVSSEPYWTRSISALRTAKGFRVSANFAPAMKVSVSVSAVIRAPVFYMAVGSQANIGGAASAPVVASAFHPTLAPVGVLLAVLGYALGTYAAWICGLLMAAVAP